MNTMVKNVKLKDLEIKKVPEQLTEQDLKNLTGGKDDYPCGRDDREKK